MPVLGRQFFFPFSHATRVDAAFGHLGSTPASVELRVYDASGEVVHQRRFLDLPPNGSCSTRHDAKSDNLARFVGANLLGLVAIEGDDLALMTASSLAIGKGMTSCALLRPIQVAAGNVYQAPVAIGSNFHVLVTNPYPAQVRLRVEVAPSGEPFQRLGSDMDLECCQTALSEDVFGPGKPALVRVTAMNGTPFLAWGLGIGRDRSELYPLYP